MNIIVEATGQVVFYVISKQLKPITDKHMIHVIVSYRVKPEFVQENKLNIEKFLKRFEDLDHSRFNYSVFLNSDGLTFTHISHYRDGDIQKELLATPAFLDFQKKRDDSGLDGSHRVQVLEHIGSTGSIL